MRNPLSDLDAIKADEHLKKKTLQAIMHHKAKRHPALWILTGALACILLVFIFQQLPSNQEPHLATKDIYAYVSVDINPSMEFQLDENNEILEIVAYNEDASTILNQQDLTGKNIQEALAWLIANESIQSYMVDGFMQVSVYSDDTSYSSNLEATIQETLANVYDETQYGCSCVSKEEHKTASDHHISFGKYQLIEQIITYNTTYTIEALQNKSMRELHTLYEEVSGSPYQGGRNHGNGNHQGSGNRNGHGQ